MTAAAAPGLQRQPTDGWVRIPSSLIENQWTLTRAELALALIAQRRASGHAEPKTVSDATWQNWTHLSARHKKNAVRGLQRKGLHIDGRGEKAKYWFDTGDWRAYLHTARTKARTAGRKETAVDPRPGAKISPQCRERGCAMLFDETALSCSDASQNGKPVSQNSPLRLVPPPAPIPASQKDSTPATATPNRKPVSQNLAAAWAATLVSLQAFFPILGVSFLVQLLAAVKVVFGPAVTFTDAELSAAVMVAGNVNLGKQKFPGLFLLTVPETLAAIRAGRVKLKPDTPDRGAGGAGGLTASIRSAIDRTSAALRARPGDEWAELANRLLFIRGHVPEDASIDDVDALEPQLQELESKIVALAEREFMKQPAAARAALLDAVKLDLRPYEGTKYTDEMRADLRNRFRVRALLEAISVPGLTVWYA